MPEPELKCSETLLTEIAVVLLTAAARLQAQSLRREGEWMPLPGVALRDVDIRDVQRIVSNVAEHALYAAAKTERAQGGAS